MKVEALAEAETGRAGAAEGPWELPKGWAWARVGDLPMGGGGSVTPNREPGAPFVLYSVPTFESGQQERVCGASIESTKQLVAAHSLLVCKINPRINRVWKVGPHSRDEGRIIASTEWIVVRRANGVEPDYLRHFLSTERTRQYLAANVSGVGGSLMRVNAATVGEIVFPLPPLPEQRRIVERIDALFAEIAEGEAALKEARKGLALFRRSLLKAAVTGELTRDWREVNNSAETGADLLAGIRAKHDSKARNRRSEFVTPDQNEELHELPRGWAWARVAEVGETQLGRQRAPQHHFGPHMRPYLRVANVFEDYFDLNDVNEMNFSPAGFETYKLEAGDILLNEGQTPELLGRPAMWKGQLENCCFQNTLIRFRPYSRLSGEYCLLVFRYYLWSGRFKRESQITTNIAHLSNGRFRTIEFPVPPPDEQIEIVRRATSALAAGDDAEKGLDAEAADAARLKQAILKAAFEGRLVPQDPADEPASELLAHFASALPAARRRGRNSHALKGT
jgi:type I restriction enzyme, S subunit